MKLELRHKGRLPLSNRSRKMFSGHYLQGTNCGNCPLQEQKKLLMEEVKKVKRKNKDTEVKQE